MTTTTAEHFDHQYQTHLKHLKLKGLQPKTIEAYSRTIRRIGDTFAHQIDDLTVAQLTDYFSDLVASQLLEYGQARSVRAEVLLRTCLAQALGGAWPDQAPENPSPAGHRDG